MNTDTDTTIEMVQCGEGTRSVVGDEARVDACEQELSKSTERARPGNSPAELEDIPGMCAFEISTAQPVCKVATGGNSEVDRKREEKSESQQSITATALPADKIVQVSREVIDKKAGASED